MAKDRLDDFELFYQEIPTHDYLSEFDTEIEDLVDDHSTNHGLDSSQVSRLAEDTTPPEAPATESGSSSHEPQLFQG